MHGYDSNTVRSRYDYYYSISSPSLSQATNYYEKQASLFGEPVAPLLPQPIQRSPSPHHPIATPLTPFNAYLSSSTSSAGAHTNFATSDVHSSLIENFDNHLYESIRKNILDKQNNNHQAVTNDLTKHQIWTQHSSSSTNTPPTVNGGFSGDDYGDLTKRAATSFDNYKTSDSDLVTNKFRISSAHDDMRKFHQISIESTSDTSDNNNNSSNTNKSNSINIKITSKPATVKNCNTSKATTVKKPPRAPFLAKRNKTMSSIAINSASTSCSSKLNHTVSHVIPKNTKPTPKPTKKNPPFTMVKSKSDLMSLKSYPESFTIVTSPRRSPSAGYCESKRRKTCENDDDDDEMVNYEWVKPSPSKLYEAAQATEATEMEMVVETPYVTDAFGQQIVKPTTPILTDKVMIGSSHRVAAGSINSHKKLAFAIINDYKNRHTRLLQHRHSDDNINLDGRFSPYTRYCLQRELSVPALNRLESFESDDGEFYYYFQDDPNEESGRKTSIGFVHKKNRLSSSMSNLSKRRPQSELQKSGPKFISTPNFVKINKRAVIQSMPLEKINPRMILHRSLKGVLKVFNNTNIQKRTFSLDNMDIFLPNGQIDPNLLMPMPINNEEKRSNKLEKQQKLAQKKRDKVLRRRRLSPIAGTPSKESEERKWKMDIKTPKKKVNTPMARLEERLKKDKFGRLITPKKAPLPDFRKKSPKKKKKGDVKFDREEEKTEEPDERDQKAIDFMQQLQARNILGRTLKARMDAKKPPPLTKQGSRQSIESIGQDKPTLKKKSSFSSLKSLSSSIKTIGSIRTNKSNSVDDEEAEAGDEITKLKNVKEVKKDAKSKIKGSMKILSLGRVTSASSTKSQKDSAPPPSRSASKTSILSHSSGTKAPRAEVDDKAGDTPSRKSDILRAPSTSSVMSMTTAAITANPLNTTLTITNQLATQGAEILEKKMAAGEKIEEMPSTSAAAVAASNPDADRASMASQKTVSSQKTNTSKTGSRKTSAKVTSGRSSAKGSAGQRSKSSLFGAIVSAHHVVKKLARRKSDDSIKSEKSDATHITIGPGHGADNKDVGPIAGKILEHSQRSLENVQKTVDKATHDIHQTINEKLSDLKTLEKQLSKSNLLEHDANNNDVEKKSTKGISRHSTKIDMKTDTSTNLTTGTTTATDTQSNNKNKNNDNNNLPQSTILDKDRISVNAISVAPRDDDSKSMARADLQHQDSDASNQMNSSTSSSMDEMNRKRKRCWGLSSCCARERSESAQMIAGKSTNILQPKTKCEKFKACMCYPFEKVCCSKRRKVVGMKMDEEEKLSWWKKICCCCGCCRRCRNKDKEKMKKKKMMKETMSQQNKSSESCWSRMNCFKFCKPCCGRIADCCCSKCCRKRQDSMTSMESTEPKPNETPSSCTRFFCFCCLCCRKSPEPSEIEQKRISMTSQQKSGNCCSRMCTALFCCCCKKKVKKDSRRTSMLSKKQSLAPTIPPPEEQKPKLDMVLVEHASLMKGAIPVLPLFLAYFCLVCNVIIPGSGTIFSGMFCLCIGIPRFSQHDGARGRIGSFIINCIVGASQAFTIIFCLVGWGWSIWWGTIMIHLSKRYRKIKRAEKLRQEDLEREAEAAAEKGGGMPKPPIARGKSRDVERGIN